MRYVWRGEAVTYGAMNARELFCFGVGFFGGVMSALLVVIIDRGLS